MGDRKDSRPAAGRKRFLKLAGMTATLAGRYAGHAIANGFRNVDQRREAREALHGQAGAELARTLGDLKGAVMKLGQLASQASDFLPDEIAGPLKSLQKQAPPMPFEVIVDQIEAEFGQSSNKLFAELDVEPYAAASIGQVHRGRLADGREVVVKVQYPGVAQSCDSDLAQLKFALRMGRLVKVRKAVLDDLFEEIRARLHEELDYVQEARNMALFREYFDADDHIIIPQVVPELCGAQVLTMVLEPGDHLDELGEAYDQELRNQLAVDLFHFMCRSVFHLNAVHADPNPANFAFRPDGSLVVYDFGCVKRLEPEIVRAYGDVLRAALDENWSAADEALCRLGVRVPGSPAVEHAFYASWRDLLLGAFSDNAAFDFGASNLHQAVMARTPEMMQRLHQFQPAVRTAYVDRMSAGHYWTLKGLQAQVALGPLLRDYLH